MVAIRVQDTVLTTTDDPTTTTDIMVLQPVVPVLATALPTVTVITATHARATIIQTVTTDTLARTITTITATPVRAPLMADVMAEAIQVAAVADTPEAVSAAAADRRAAAEDVIKLILI